MTSRGWLVWVVGVAAFLAGPGQAGAAVERGRPVPGELIVKYRSGVSEPQRASIRGALPGASRLHPFGFIRAEHIRFGGGLSIEQAIARIQHDPRVEYAEPNYEVHVDGTPNDPRYAEQWGMHNTGQDGGTPGADIGAPQAWNIATGDPNMRVGVIDTGIDYNHPDLVGNIWTNVGEIPGNGIDDDHNGYIDDVHGYDFANNDGDPMDDHGHGTHCAGTIAARTDNGAGVAGVNWHLKLVAIKFLAANGFGTIADAIRSVQYAHAIGVRLTSNSWGGGEFSQSLLDAINEVGAEGQLFVASSGNTNTDTDASPSYPASYGSPNVIAVLNTTHDDLLGDFSNYGLTSVDLGAPGTHILSCQRGGGYQFMSGTSMAAPYVAGACALLWSRFPNATNLQIKQIILAKVDPVAALAGKCVTGGRLNLFRAISEVDLVPPGAVVDLIADTPGSTTMGLAWTATGDDGGVGTAARYDLRYSLAPINSGNFAAATPVAGPIPQLAGADEAFEVSGLSYSTTYYFALVAYDEYGNGGPISNVATGTTQGAPTINVDPPSLSQTLVPGQSSQVALTIRNIGAGRLDFSVPTPELILAQSGLVRPGTTYPASARPRDAEDPGPSVLGDGGPDAFGYRWVDSDEPGGPAFAWVDLTAIGTRIALSGEDSNAGPIALGFPFPFYGSTFTSVHVQTNGALSFDDTSAPYSNVPLPSAGGMTNMIAPWWDDLNFGVSQRAYTYADGSRFIVEWLAVPHHAAGFGPYTFQAILYPSGEIRYQYLAMAAATSSATIGIQNATKAVGLNVEYNADYVHDSLAVRILPLRQWLSVSPQSGTLGAGNSMDVNVHFDATGLYGGAYSGELQLINNSPNASVTVPASLTVTGSPNLVAADTTNFGPEYWGGTYHRDLVVANNGSDSLFVTDIASFDGTLSFSPRSFHVGPGTFATVEATWQPVVASTLNALFQITSNDPDSPVTQKRAIGSAVTSPVLGADPRSFDVTLDANTSTTNIVHVTNTGDTTLAFTAQPIFFPGSEPNARRLARPANLGARLPGTGSARPGAPTTPNAGGGPDAFGYRWADSREPGGVVFDWIEISGNGTPIPMAGDDVTAAARPIGFDFPFYGTTFSTFRLCTNGWISFTSSLTSHLNTPLPNAGAGVPENLIAAFWDDLTFFGGAQAFYRYDGGRLIIEYKNVPRQGQLSSPNTFEIVLHPDGRIVTQYLTMPAAALNSATVGIQNATKDDGLQATADASYVTDSLAVQFSPPDRWLTVTPSFGSIPAGGSVDLTVGFDATGLRSGDYLGAVRFDTNYPVIPHYDLAATMHVIGVPDIASAPAAVAFDTTFVGFPSNRTLAIHNIGEQDLTVTGITVNDTIYTTAGGIATIAPGDSSVVTVTFSPIAVGSLPATLTVASNDPDTPNYAVSLVGYGQIPPDLELTPPAIVQNVPAGASGGLTLLLDNLGASNLYWTLTLSSTPAGWLAATPPGGTVMPHNHNSIQLTYNAALLAPGTYNGNVHFTSNDPDEVAVDVPVTLHVNQSVGVTDGLPAHYGLKLAGANPVRQHTTIELALPMPGRVEVGVYDLRGALVLSLANGEKAAGYHSLRWDGRDASGNSLSQGVYFVRAKTPGGEFRQRIVYLK